MSSFDRIVAVAHLMQGFPGPWFVSGGWAIDLFVGRVTREHEDREVGIFRQDQQALPLLNAAWRAWLKAALPRCYGQDPWLAEL
jgi:hypothetical protein